MQSHECNTKTPTDLQTSNICWVYFILLQQRLDHRERNAVDVLAVSRETHCILAQTNSVLALRNTIGLLQVFLVNVRVWEVHFHPQDSHIVLHLQRASIDSKKNQRIRLEVEWERNEDNSFLRIFSPSRNILVSSCIF